MEKNNKKLEERANTAMSLLANCDAYIDESGNVLEKDKQELGEILKSFVELVRGASKEENEEMLKILTKKFAD